MIFGPESKIKVVFDGFKSKCTEKHFDLLTGVENQSVFGWICLWMDLNAKYIQKHFDFGPESKMKVFLDGFSFKSIQKHFDVWSRFEIQSVFSWIQIQIYPKTF